MTFPKEIQERVPVDQDSERSAVTRTTTPWDAGSGNEPRLSPTVDGAFRAPSELCRLSTVQQDRCAEDVQFPLLVHSVTLSFDRGVGQLLPERGDLVEYPRYPPPCRAMIVSDDGGESLLRDRQGVTALTPGVAGQFDESGPHAPHDDTISVVVAPVRSDRTGEANLASHRAAILKGQETEGLAHAGTDPAGSLCRCHVSTMDENTRHCQP
jgi:hypothetical protein